MRPKYLDICYEKGFENEISQLDGEFTRKEEFLRGVDWQLGRKPDSGQLVIDEPVIRGLPFHDITGKMPVVVYYTYSDDKVFLISIKRFDYQTEVDCF